MNRKSIIQITLILSLFFASINLVNSDLSTSEAVTTYFPAISSFQFQQDSETLFMNITSGNLNATDSTIIQDYGLLSIWQWKWLWIFTALEDCTINLVFPNETTHCSINGNAINSTYTATINTGEITRIMWENSLVTPLPFPFIMGMAGLGAMFFGLIFLVVNLKEKKYEKALITGTVTFLIGFGFFLGWLIT